jgi:predicted deacylase
MSVRATAQAGILMIAAMMLVVWPAAAPAQQPPATPHAPFTIANHSVAPGQRLDVDLHVAAGPSDPATRVLVTVFHGVRPGPVLGLTAGVHGYEFAPILAAQRLLDVIDSMQLTGTVLLVRLANVAAFEERVPYVNPHDRKNLNRAFPGRADGTQTERIAWALTTEVVRRSDVLVELHSGDGAEWLEEFVGVYGGPLAARYDTARAVGLAFGLRNVIRYSMDTQQQIDSGRSLNRQAVADGKPTVLVEIGENGRRDTAFVEPIVNGVMNALRVLAMVDGAAQPARPDTRWFDSTASVSATATGIFTPAAARGYEVQKGGRVGTVRDYSGRVVEELVSPVNGYAIYGLAGPPVKAGESVVTIAVPAKEPF